MSTAEESQSLLGNPRDRDRTSQSDAATNRDAASSSSSSAATRPAAAAASASSLDATAAASSSSSAAASRSIAPVPHGSGAPLLHLTIQRTDLPRLEVSVPSDWTLTQLRDLCYPPSADAVDPAAASAVSSSSSSSTPLLPNAPPAVASASAAVRPPRELIVLYCGRKIPTARWSSSLSALGIRSNTGLHMIWQEVLPLPSYQANAGAGGGEPDEYFDRGWDRHSREPLGSWLEFVLGLALGFLLGFLALLWLLQPRVSRRCRLGILTGLSCNLIVGISQMMHRGDDGDYAHSGPTPAGAPPRSIAGNGGDMIYTTDDQGEPRWIPRSGPRLIGPTRASTAQGGGG